ncbi:TetR/AcrR family transcriptional regulator [Gryllotalpicola reticulitermitis]|uniref:TetR/AcrR family transcriptional regulator n=1 Tax=Gryllotalpicola reticulitermitis TaxID=1184153 RepID=A0ABV8Q7S4_9MICO
MNARPSQAGGLREITREAVRERIAEQALILFDENGFEQTTIEDIVTAVGISSRSYFRYYASKEEAVIRDLVVGGAKLRDNVAQRLLEETPWQALHHGMRDGAEQIDARPEKWLRTMRVIYSAASLRARNLEKHLTWSALLTPLINEHLDGDPRFGDLPARTLVGRAFACLDAALASWTEANAAAPFRDAIDAAFAVRT